jgi:hypothetical protein
MVFLSFSTDSFHFYCGRNVYLFKLGKLLGDESCYCESLADEDCEAFQDDEVVLLKQFFSFIEVNLNIPFTYIDFIGIVNIFIPQF